MGDAEKACSRDDAQAIELEAAVLPAELQGRFQGVEAFAQSPQSACYLATQPSSGFRGLLKVIPLRDLDASERGRLKRELRKQVKLVHPNLPRIVDGGELSSALWLLRDHVDGESLGQRLRRDGPLEVSQALAITAQIASALDELHRAGILHRDVRPSRIVLQPRSEGIPIVKLIDAGIAARQRTGAVFDRLGTPAYMSPEQIAGKLVSFRSDLYALGCMLFEMLAGKPPFGEGNDANELRALLESHQHDVPPALPVDAPAPVATLISALLEKDPRKRPFSAQQVRRTLEPLLPAGMPVISPTRASVPGMVSPAPIGAPGLSPPRPSGVRTSQPGGVPLPKAPPRPAGGHVPRPPPSLLREELTEELDLAEVPQTISPPGGFRDRNNTFDISSDELASLRLPPSIAPPNTASRGAAPPNAGLADEPLPMAVEVAMDEAADDAKTSLISAASLGVVVGRKPEPSSMPPPASEPAPAPPVASEAPPAMAAPSRGADAGALSALPAPRRAAVAFDVESLFNDPEPPPVVSVAPASPSAAPKPPDEEGASTVLYQKPEETEAARVAYREAVETAANDDRTVVVRAPAPPSSHRSLWAGAGVLGVAIVMFAVCRGGEDAAAPPLVQSSAQGATEQPAADTAPRDRAQPPSAQAAPTRGDSVPAAQPMQAAAEPADPPAAVVAPAENAAPSEPGSAASATAEATPGAGAQPSDAVAADGSLPPARSNRPDAVMGQRASRADRVAKATQLKAEGRAHYQAGRFKEAARSYDLATRETPSDGGAFAGLGASLLSANDADGAIRAYQRAVQIDGQSSGFHAALGRAYALKGDKLRARASYMRALAINPQNGAAKQGIERLK